MWRWKIPNDNNSVTVQPEKEREREILILRWEIFSDDSSYQVTISNSLNEIPLKKPV